jgi:hypothetical protein
VTRSSRCGQLAVLTGAVLVVPPVTGLGAALDDVEPVAGAEDDGLAGGGGGVVLTLGLGAGEVEPHAELAAALAVVPTGPPLPPVPGFGVAVPLGVTDGDGSGDVDGLAGGEVLAGADGEVLAEPVSAGLELVLTAGFGVQDAAAAGTDGFGWWPGVVWWLPEPFSEPPPLPLPPLAPVTWPPLCELLSAEEAEVVAMGVNWLSAKPPAATTATAMPMPATGRSQPGRGRAWPGWAAVSGRKRSTTAQKAATTGSKNRRRPAYQAEADSNESIGRFSRSRIRSSPSADGSIESAAACRARRRASS